MSEISDFVSNDKEMMMLIADGKYESEFSIMGNIIKIRVLDYEQYGDALGACSAYDLAFKSYALQSQVLRRAFDSINGKQFPNLDEAAIFINKLPPILVEYMFQKYEEAKGVRDVKILNAIGKQLKNGSRSQSQKGTGDTPRNSSPTGSTDSGQSNSAETL
jgi:hypothetical protein